MAEESVEAQELNELRWWSYWGRATMLDGSSSVIISTAFPEPLFNHASILSHGPGAEKAIGKALKLFKQAGVEPSFFVIDDQRFYAQRLSLESAGFSVVDTMEVMRAAPHWSSRPPATNMVAVRGDTRRWVEAYIRSFYDRGAPTAAIEASVGKAAKDKDVSLVAAMRGSEVVGGMALYAAGGLLGAYCVGTVPEYRRTGVAGDMLAHARKIASENRLSLVLQTFASDRVVGYYVGQGFQRSYRKLVLSSSRSA